MQLRLKVEEKVCLEVLVVLEVVVKLVWKVRQVEEVEVEVVVYQAVVQLHPGQAHPQ